MFAMLKHLYLLNFRNFHFIKCYLFPIITHDLILCLYLMGIKRNQIITFVSYQRLYNFYWIIH